MSNNSPIYDYIIAGAGPSGLTLSYLLGKLNYKCLLIDKNNNVGGSHRVIRVNDLFTEHGPRIYSTSYVNTIELLRSMNIDFFEIFTVYNFKLSNIGQSTLNNLSWKEKFLLGFEFIFNFEKNKNISMKEYMEKHNFSNSSQDYINRLCLLTDGASADRYSLFQFLELANQQALYNLYQPKKPNDEELFPRMVNSILSTKNVEIMLNTEIVEITEKNNMVESMIINSPLGKQTLFGKNYILAISPVDILKLTKSFPGIENIVEKNTYNNYIPIVFHWNTKLDLPKIWGFPKSDWGLAFILLSDYMTFNNENSKTVISTCITLPNSISTKTNKTANNTLSETELIQEVFRQLKEAYSDLPGYTYSILSPTVKRYNNEWQDMDSPFIRTKDNKFLSSVGNTSNLYNVGTQNGNSPYNFTSFESAVSNALVFINENVLKEGEIQYEIKYSKSFRTYMRILIVLIILIIIFIIIFAIYKLK